MPNDREQQKDSAMGLSDDDGLQLGRTVFLRHAAFSSPDSLARDTIQRYASFLGKSAGVTIARWSVSGEGWGNWLNLEWLKGVSPVRRKVTSKVAKQTATARSVPLPAAEKERVPAFPRAEAHEGRVEGSTSPAQPKLESSVSHGVVTARGGTSAPSIHKAIERSVETDRSRTDLPAAGDIQAPHLASHPEGLQESGANSESIPASTATEPAVSLTPAGVVARGHQTILSTVSESRAAKPFQGPPIFQRPHIQRMRVAEGPAGRAQSVGSTAAERARASGPTDSDASVPKEELIQARQDPVAMLNQSKAPGDAPSPVKQIWLQPSAIASAEPGNSLEAQPGPQSSYSSQADSTKNFASDSAAIASQVATRADRKSDSAASSADPPVELAGTIHKSDSALATGSAVTRDTSSSSLPPAAIIQRHPGHAAIQRHQDSGRNSIPPLLPATTEGPIRIARAQSVAATRAANSPRAIPEKSTPSSIPKEDSSSHAETAGPEVGAAGDSQVGSVIRAPGESTYRFLQSRSASALYSPKLQLFGKDLMQRHRDMPITYAGTAASSSIGSAESRPVVQLATAPAQQPEAGAAIAVPAATHGNQSSAQDVAARRATAFNPAPTNTASANTASATPEISPAMRAVLHAKAVGPERPGSGRDLVTPDVRADSPSLHIADRPAVMAESIPEPTGDIGMVFAQHTSLDSAIGDAGAASFRGARNELSVRDRLGSGVATTSQTNPVSSTGLEAAPMVSRISLKNTSASSVGAPTASHPAVKAERTLGASGSVGTVFAQHVSPHSAIGDPGSADFAGTGNEPTSRDHSGSGITGTSQTNSMRSTGFEAASMVSRISLKNTSASSVGAPTASHPAVMAERTLGASGPVGTVFAQHVSPGSAIGDPGSGDFAGTGNEPTPHNHLGPEGARSSQTNSARSAGFEAASMVSRASLRNSHVDATPHARVPSHRAEHLQSGDLSFPQHGTAPATTYVLRASSDPAYTSQRLNEQAPAVTGGINLRRKASPFTPAPSAGASRNPHYLFPASATSSLHFSSGSVPMLHVESSAQGLQGMTAPNHDNLLFRSAPSAPPVPSAPASSVTSFPSAAQPAVATAPSIRNVDVAQLANRVYDLLVRRLSSERQRRGM